MRNDEEGGKTLALFDVMLFEVDCVLPNAVEVKHKQLTAKGCRVLLWVKSAVNLDLLRGRILDAEDGQVPR